MATTFDVVSSDCIGEAGKAVSDPPTNDEVAEGAVTANGHSSSDG